MTLPAFALKRPVMALVLNLVIVLFGIIGYSFLGVREYPAVDPPVVTVRTNYTGANADIVESQITEPLEKAINGIAGVKSISSNSSLGNSQITVEFELSANLETAANDVRDKVSQSIRNLPQDIDSPPTVQKADANSDAILAFSIQSDTRNPLEVTEFATNVLQEQIQTIPGVSSLMIWGEKKYAMRLWLDPLKMAALNVTGQDLKAALDRENVELPAGKLAGDNTELILKTAGRINTEEEFNQLIIRNIGGKTIRFSDIGEAVLGPENEETLLKESNIPAIGLALTPQPGANYIEIADEFYKRYERIKAELPADYKTKIIFDQTKFVKRSITDVKETLFISILLVIIIIYLFFRSWLIAFRPLIDIPVSLIGAFFIMYLADFSINILTMLGIVLATGLVVDDGIVVTENIFKKMEGGMDKAEAAKKGSEEIYFAVLSTSITLAIVFLPIIFLQGFVGRLFREFGIVVAGAVLISAFVSLTLTPVLNLKLGGSHTNHSWFYRVTEPFYVGLDNSYRVRLQGFMRFRWLALPVILICFGLIYYFGNTLPNELAPMEDRGEFRVVLTAPEGTSYDYMDKYVTKLTQFVVDSVKGKQGVISFTAPSFLSTSVNTGIMRLILEEKENRKQSQQEIVNYVTKNIKRFPEARATVIQNQTISTGGTARFGLPVQFVLQNNDFNKIKEILPKFVSEVQKSPCFQGFDANLKFNKPELNINIDRAKASELNVSMADVSQTLQLALSGRRLGYFIRGGKQYQIIGEVDRENRDEPTDLKKLMVRNGKGELVSLDNIVQLSEQSNPPQLYHYNRYKSATISAGLAPGKTLGEGIAEMRRIEKTLLDESFRTSLSGASRDFEESSGNTSFALGLALILIFLVLAAQFESFIDPFIIMVTVPLAIAGALFSLWFLDLTINIFSQIGIIMLIGLVTKNGILIVEFANKKIKEGLSKKEAVIDAAADRLRPILMTSIATALGALPIALAYGASSTSRISLGVVIVGGILFSLILSLFIVPAIYTYLHRE